MNYSIYLEKLFEEMKERSKTLSPQASYTAYLASLNSESVSKKLMEEAFELSVANIAFETNNSSKIRSDLIGEAADVMYHLMALLITKDIDFKEVVAKLEDRGGVKKVDEINFKKD